jgi:hypothetical protein
MTILGMFVVVNIMGDSLRATPAVIPTPVQPAQPTQPGQIQPMQPNQPYPGQLTPSQPPLYTNSPPVLPPS